MAKPTKATAAEELRGLLSEFSNNEMRCREYLNLALNLFAPYTGITSMLDYSEENPGASGPSDLIVFCDHHDGGELTRTAYVWEIKAPQVPMFVKCSKNRMRPSAELAKAENQLLHYWDDCRNDSFRHANNICSNDDIRMGGILISQKSARVKNSEKNMPAFRKALRLRRHTFYGPQNIKLMLWDDVLAHLSPKFQSDCAEPNESCPIDYLHE